VIVITPEAIYPSQVQNRSDSINIQGQLLSRDHQVSANVQSQDQVSLVLGDSQESKNNAPAPGGVMDGDTTATIVSNPRERGILGKTRLLQRVLWGWTQLYKGKAENYRKS
jgi:hypothetical protein